MEPLGKLNLHFFACVWMFQVLEMQHLCNCYYLMCALNLIFHWVWWGCWSLVSSGGWQICLRLNKTRKYSAWFGGGVLWVYFYGFLVLNLFSAAPLPLHSVLRAQECVSIFWIYQFIFGLQQLLHFYCFIGQYCIKHCISYNLLVLVFKGHL